MSACLPSGSTPGSACERTVADAPGGCKIRVLDGRRVSSPDTPGPPRVESCASGSTVNSCPTPPLPPSAVTDHGLTVGDGVFEAIKVVDGQPFALTRHLERLARSARGLGLPDVDDDAVRRGVAAVLADQELPLGRIRITYTGRSVPAGLRTRGRRADAHRRRRLDEGVARHHGRGDRALAAQRARGARRPQDHVVRRERRSRSPRRTSAAPRGDLRQPRRQPVRGHGDQRLLRRRRRAAHAHARQRLPGRGDPGARAGVVRRHRDRRADRGRRPGQRGLPGLDDAGRPGRVALGRPRAPAPGPVTTKVAELWRQREPELLGL